MLTARVHFPGSLGSLLHSDEFKVENSTYSNLPRGPRRDFTVSPDLLASHKVDLPARTIVPSTGTGQMAIAVLC